MGWVGIPYSKTEHYLIAYFCFSFLGGNRHRFCAGEQVQRQLPALVFEVASSLRWQLTEM